MSLAWGRFRPLLRTTAMRLALHYALWQVAVLALALLGLFWATYSYVQQEIKDSLVQEMEMLRSLPEAMLVERVRALAEHQPGTRRTREYLIVTPTGAHIGNAGLVWPENLPLDDRVHDLSPHFSEDERGDEEKSSNPAIATNLAGGSRLLIVREAGLLEDMRAFLPWAALGVLLFTATLSLGLGLALGWRWLQRMDSIRLTTASIMDGALDARVPLSSDKDEFDALAQQLNTMLERIEHAVSGMRRVSDTIAHDLRRPLTRLKTRLEITLRETRSQAEDCTAMQRAIDDADELMRSFEAMLAIARLDAGSEILAHDAVDMTALLMQLGMLYADEAEDEGRVLGMTIAAGLCTRGSAPLLTQAVANSLDNALLHTPDATPIELRAFASGHELVIEVVDHGSGIPPEQRERMLERFTRGEQARTRAGSGLGLALMRAVIEAHHGRLQLAETPGGGLTLALRLPLLAA